MIRFGMVGTGRITDWVLKGASLEPRFQAVAVCSRDADRGRAFAAAHAIPKAYSDLDEMAADPEVDAVYIGTPNHTHHDLAIRAMRRGKHVLCEKPLASNAREVREMVETARSCGVLLMEGMISTLLPHFREVSRRIPDLGPVRHYSATYCQYSSKYDKFRQVLAGKAEGPLPASLNPDCSGGALLDIGIYTLYPMVALFGKPSAVHAHSTTCPVPSLRTIDLQGAAVFEYEGMTAEVVYSKITDSRLRTEISGEQGLLSLDRIHLAREVSFVPRGTPASGRSEDPEARIIPVPADPDPYTCEFREFIDVLESGGRESPVNRLSTSLAVAELMDEIRRQSGVVFPADEAGPEAPGLHIRKARTEDVPRIWAILRQAVDQMLREGKHQWSRNYPRPEHVEADIARGVGHVLCRADGAIIAYAAIVYTGEPAYDDLEGRWLSDQPYVVVHRIAVADECKRQGIATRYMQLIAEQAAAQGFHSFRIDTNDDNFSMQKMLARLGFSYTGECHYPQGTRRCYEKLI